MSQLPATKTEHCPISGLTPNQEKAALLLASGESVTDVANLVKVDRSTLYQWMKRITFKAFINQKRLEVQRQIESQLMGLYGAAIEVISDTMRNGKDSDRLKAAFWLIDRVGNMPIGQTDARDEIKKQVGNDTFDFGFDEREYNSLLKKNNLVDWDSKQMQGF